MTLQILSLCRLWPRDLRHRLQVHYIIPAAWRQPDLLASIRAGMGSTLEWVVKSTHWCSQGGSSHTTLSLTSSTPRFIPLFPDKPTSSNSALPTNEQSVYCSIILIDKYSGKRLSLNCVQIGFTTVCVGKFRAGKIHLGGSSDNSTAKNTSVNTFKMHWEFNNTKQNIWSIPH